jgi:hypothetical protein
MSIIVMHMSWVKTTERDIHNTVWSKGPKIQHCESLNPERRVR